MEYTHNLPTDKRCQRNAGVSFYLRIVSGYLCDRLLTLKNVCYEEIIFYVCSTDDVRSECVCCRWF